MGVEISGGAETSKEPKFSWFGSEPKAETQQHTPRVTTNIDSRPNSGDSNSFAWFKGGKTTNTSERHKQKPTFTWFGDSLSKRTRAGRLTEVDFLVLDKDASENHERALNVFNNLVERLEETKRSGDKKLNSEIAGVLTWYSHSLENIDLRPLVPIFQEINGAESIVYIARLNLVKQVDQILLGAEKVLSEGFAKIQLAGTTAIVDNLGQIENELWRVALDTKKIKETAIEEAGHGNAGFLRKKLLDGLEKYMFDGKNAEKRAELTQDLMIIGENTGEEFFEQLKSTHVLPEDAKAGEKLSLVDLHKGLTREQVEARIVLENSGDRYIDNVFYKDGRIPDTVVVNISPMNSQLSDEQILALDYLFIDRFRLPKKDRPNIIVYTNGGELSGEIKGYLSGFQFCKTADELHDTIELAKGLSNNRKQESLYKKDTLEEGQKKAYNNSELREWENITASTYESLKRLIDRVLYRNDLFRSRYTQLFQGNRWFEGNRHDIAPSREIKTVLDLGTGEGRIAQMLARLGLNVLGVDLSSKQLKRARERIREEGRVLRREEERRGSAAEALLMIKKEKPDLDIDFSDKRTRQRFLTTEGSFFGVKRIVENTLANWKKIFPNIDREGFFNDDEKSFDMAMFNWHTFCEVGSLENQKDVLEQIFSVLTPGGELVIEIPDRLFEPYASALQAYHEAHPDEPYGTIRDRKPDDFDPENPDRYYPPRYFPDINELVLLLRSLGYEIDTKEDIQTYIVGEMTLKEHFITARKPKK